MNRPEAEWLASLGLACLVGIGSSPVLGLLRHHDPRRIWGAPVKRLCGMGLSRGVAERFAARRKAWRAEAILARMADTSIRFVPLSGLNPEARCLAFPPAGLFVAASEEAWSELLETPKITVVGTRKATPYGRAIARAAGARLARAGIAVVSGLAFGIDAEAHRGALAADGLTVAVMGCGPNVVYPRSHAGIRASICERGAVVSEYPPDTPPAPWRFPARNRIMAALGHAVLIVEAGERSGATITVDEALGLGRSVFAVPGPLGSDASRGCHRLIAQGASIVESLEDLVQEYFDETRTERGGWETLTVRRMSGRSMPATSVLSAIGRLALQGLSQGPRSIDQLAAAAGCSAREMGAALALLELSGEVTRAGTGAYAAAL